MNINLYYHLKNALEIIRHLTCHLIFSGNLVQYLLVGTNNVIIVVNKNIKATKMAKLILSFLESKAFK